MFYIYVLHCVDGQLYTGYSPDLKSRLKAHIKGYVRATSYRLPVKLIHYEVFLEEKDAKQREAYLKGGNGKKELEIMLQEYFRKHEWRKELADELELPKKPQDALICPVCGGAKKAATQSFFTKSGKRTSGHVQICLTCKGRGWVTKEEMDNAKELVEL